MVGENDSIGAEVVNVPGSLTWNDVATKDPEGAQEFYGGLFGWGFVWGVTGPDGPDYWTVTHDGASNGRNGGLRRQVGVTTLALTLILGLAMTAVALPIAGRRVWFLYRLITSGQPAPDRVENVTKRAGETVKL